MAYNETPTKGTTMPTKKIINELGNEITMSVTQTLEGVKITAIGPHSEVEHIWTPGEAWNLLNLLKISCIDLSATAYKKPE